MINDSLKLVISITILLFLRTFFTKKKNIRTPQRYLHPQLMVPALITKGILILKNFIIHEKSKRTGTVIFV